MERYSGLPIELYEASVIEKMKKVNTMNYDVQLLEKVSVNTNTGILLGLPGSGKTRIACRYIKETIDIKNPYVYHFRTNLYSLHVEVPTLKYENTLVCCEAYCKGLWISELTKAGLKFLVIDNKNYQENLNEYEVILCSTASIRHVCDSYFRKVFIDNSDYIKIPKKYMPNGYFTWYICSGYARKFDKIRAMDYYESSLITAGRLNLDLFDYSNVIFEKSRVLTENRHWFSTSTKRNAIAAHDNGDSVAGMRMLGCIELTITQAVNKYGDSLENRIMECECNVCYSDTDIHESTMLGCCKNLICDDCFFNMMRHNDRSLSFICPYCRNTNQDFLRIVFDETEALPARISKVIELTSKPGTRALILTSNYGTARDLMSNDFRLPNKTNIVRTMELLKAGTIPGVIIESEIFPGMSFESVNMIIVVDGGTPDFNIQSCILRTLCRNKNKQLTVHTFTDKNF